MDTRGLAPGGCRMTPPPTSGTHRRMLCPWRNKLDEEGSRERQRENSPPSWLKMIQGEGWMPCKAIIAITTRSSHSIRTQKEAWMETRGDREKERDTEFSFLKSRSTHSWIELLLEYCCSTRPIDSPRHARFHTPPQPHLPPTSLSPWTPVVTLHPSRYKSVCVCMSCVFALGLCPPQR